MDDSLKRLVDALRRGVCPPEGVFDRYLPHELRVVSRVYWTPLAVAMRAAEWLEEYGVRSVVDIGSGAGKFCVAAALAGTATFTGVEQRGRLVAAARQLARALQVDDRVAFVHGSFGEVPLPVAQAYYLFNPFGENLFPRVRQLDGEVELGPARYFRDIDATELMLRGAAVGTYVLSYNGFGGEVPPSYRELRVDRELPNVLRMWQKTAIAGRKEPGRVGAGDAVEA